MGKRIQYPRFVAPVLLIAAAVPAPFAPVIGDHTIVFTKVVQYQSRFEPLQPLQAAETITVDKWFQPASQPIRKKKPVEYPALFKPPDQLDGSRLDSWLQPPSQPTYRKKAPAPLGWITNGATLETPNTITLDKWFRETNQPYLQKKKLVPVGEWKIDPKQLTLTEDPLLKWLRETNQPYPYRKRLKGVGEYVVDANQLTQPEAPLMKWFREASQPYPYKKRLGGVGEWKIDPLQLTLGEAITLDKWFQPVIQRLRRVARSALAESIYPLEVPAAPETITLDKWLSKCPDAILRRAYLQRQAFHYPIDFPAPAESITLDKWLSASAYQRRLQRLQHLHPTFFWNSETPVTLDQWLFYSREPQRKKSLVYRLPSVFPDDFPRVPDILQQQAIIRRKVVPAQFPTVFEPPSLVVPFDWFIERAERARKALRRELTAETVPLLVEDLSWLVAQVEVFRLAKHPLYFELIQIIEPIISGASATSPIETLFASDRGFALTAEDRALNKDSANRGFSDRAKDRKLGLTGRKRDFEL